MMGSRSVLCIGLDGATFDVLTPWMDDGTLPNLAAIRSSGVWGNLASTVPPLTASAWTSFMTGRNPGNHGVFHFLDLADHAAYARGQRRLAAASAADIPAIWDIVSREGGRAGLVNVPMTYPPRPVNGLMVTGMMTPPNAPFTYPAELASQIDGYRIDTARFEGETPFARDTGDAHGVNDVEGLIREYHELLLTRGAVVNQLVRREPWDFFMVVFTGTDRLGHYAWPYHAPAEQSAAGTVAAERHRAVRDYYRALDAIVGDLVDGAGPHAVTVIMSDHGMGPAWNRYVHLNGWLFQRGLIALDGSKSSRSSADRWLLRLGIPRDRVARIVRTLPISKTTIRRAANAAGRVTIDPEASQAFFMPIYNHVGGIHLNPDAPSNLVEQLRDQLMAELRDMRDPETGDSIFRRVATRSEIYDGPYTCTMPDIITVADPQYSGSLRVSHFTTMVTPRLNVEIPGAHRDNGIFLAAGPDIRHQSGEMSGLKIEDLAPTILHLLDCPVPERMDGRVLLEAMVPLRADSTRVRYTPGDGGGRWTDGYAQIAAPVTEADDERVLEHLRALGYL